VVLSEVSDREIDKYLDKVYKFETDMYPVEYFKNLGHAYTENVIQEWDNN